MTLRRPQMEANLARFRLLLEGVQRQLLHQFRIFSLSISAAQASRSSDSTTSLAASSGVFSCSNAVRSAFGVASGSAPLPARSARASDRLPA